jgi:regulation of enolase protein 1 (concanavalin A-like superfamily)
MASRYFILLVPVAALLVSACLHADDAPKEATKEATKEAAKEAPKQAAKEAAQDPNLIKGWGRWQDPDGDCRTKIDGGKLQVWVPGTAHDLSVEQNKMNAPMILQDTTGDFDIETKVSGTFEPGEPTVAGRKPYQGAGLVMALDNQNYVRLERAVFTNNNRQNHHYVSFEVRLNGQVVRLGQTTDFPIRENAPVSLRLRRRGNQVQGQVKVTDNWETLGVKPFVNGTGFQAGIAAINASNAPLTAQFENLKVTPVEASRVVPK